MHARQRVRSGNKVCVGGGGVDLVEIVKEIKSLLVLLKSEEASAEASRPNQIFLDSASNSQSEY